MDRLKGLDGIRGLLALSVALGHAFGHYTGWGSGIYPIKNSSFSVDIFFMLSGMVLYHVHHREIKEGEAGFISLFTRRVFRLYPMHLLGILLIPLALAISTGMAYPDWVGEATPRNIFGDAILMNAIGVGFHLSSNQPSWSISVELYVGTVIAYLCCRYRLAPFLIALIAIFLTYTYNIKAHDIDEPVAFLINGGIVRCLYSMSLGVIAYRTISKNADYLRNNANFSRVIGIGGAVVMLITILCVQTPMPLYFSLIAILSFSVAAIGIIGFKELNFLDSKPLSSLGKWSFSIYLLHTPLLYLFISQKTEDNSINSLMALGIVMLTVVVSSQTYKFIEKPAMKSVSIFRKKQPS